MASHWMMYLVAMVLVTGCRRIATCTVTEYGPEYMTYTGSGEQFRGACRQVLHDLGYKEKLSDTSTRYPYHAEGSSSHTDKDKTIAVRGYLQTKDEAGAEYKITTVRLGRHEPFVMLESTSPDRYKLINALNAEFRKRGIRVQQY
jgi:hypothetical protein